MNKYALIADFDLERASAFADLVQSEGLTAVIAKDGAAAIATLHEKGAPDLLLTELSLPRIDGLELIDRLRRSLEGDRTAVIVVSASRELREKATRRRVLLGIGSVLAKAVSDDSLRRIVKRLLVAADRPPSIAPGPVERARI